MIAQELRRLLRAQAVRKFATAAESPRFFPRRGMQEADAIGARNPPPIRGEEFWNPFAARFVGVGVALTVGSPK